MTADIIFEVINGLGMITLSRPQALNALNTGMIQALYNQLTEWNAHPEIKAILIKAVPNKAFCAGGDVRWLYEKGMQQDPQQLNFFKEEYQLNLLIAQLKKPYIALMNGMTMGGGVGISLHGSCPIATEHFSFAMPETSIGLFPDVGGAYLLARCPGYLGLYLGLTGNHLTAREALAAGLIKAIIPSACIDRFIIALSQLAWENPAKEIDTCVNSYLIADKAQVIPHIDKINQYFSAANIQEIMQRLSASDDPWATQTRMLLEKKSPMSLAVTYDYIHYAAQLSLAQCLQQDYTLVQQFMKDKDFYEGVRAVLIDKDKNPQWQYSDVYHISEAHRSKYRMLF